MEGQSGTLLHSCDFTAEGGKDFGKRLERSSFCKTLDGLCHLGLDLCLVPQPCDASLYLLPVANLAHGSEAARVCSTASGVGFLLETVGPSNNPIMRIVTVC